MDLRLGILLKHSTNYKVHKAVYTPDAPASRKLVAAAILISAPAKRNYNSYKFEHLLKDYIIAFVYWLNLSKHAQTVASSASTLPSEDTVCFYHLLPKQHLPEVDGMDSRIGSRNQRNLYLKSETASSRSRLRH